MALDEPKDDDYRKDESGIGFLLGKDVLDQLGGVRVDFVEQPGLGGGFIIQGIATAPGACSEGCC